MQAMLKPVVFAPFSSLLAGYAQVQLLSHCPAPGTKPA
jgi:hypothetical protein